MVSLTYPACWTCNCRTIRSLLFLYSTLTWSTCILTTTASRVSYLYNIQSFVLDQGFVGLGFWVQGQGFVSHLFVTPNMASTSECLPEYWVYTDFSCHCHLKTACPNLVWCAPRLCDGSFYISSVYGSLRSYYQKIQVCISVSSSGC